MTENSGRANFFEAYSVSELEPFARAEYDRLATEPKPAGHYWLLQECLRQLEKEKGLVPREWREYLTETFGFDREHLELAKAIRDNYATMASLSGVTMEEALAPKGESETRSDGTTSLPDANGNGEQDGGPAENQENIESEEKTTKVTGLRLLSEIAPQSTEWLWEGYIPLGEATIVEGDPGANKSSMLCDLAARLTRGQSMPCASAEKRRPQSGGALFMIGEDSVAKTVRGRLLAAGADLSRVGILDDVAIPDDMLTIHKAIKESVRRSSSLILFRIFSPAMSWATSKYGGRSARCDTWPRRPMLRSCWCGTSTKATADIRFFAAAAASD